MPNQIVNPSAGTIYYSVSGSAISAQPDITKMRAKGLGSNQALVNSLAQGYNSPVYGSRIYSSKRTQITSSKFDTVVSSGITVAASSGYAKYTKTSHNLSVGDSVFVTDTNSKVDGIQRITAKDANTFTTDMPYVSGAGTLTYKVGTGTIAYYVTGNLIARKYSTTINGVANTVLRSGGSDYGQRRAINKITALRSSGVAKAISSSYWDIYTGTFTTAPTGSANSIGDVAGNVGTTDGSEDAAANVGRNTAAQLIFRDGSPTVQTDDYDLKTG